MAIQTTSEKIVQESKALFVAHGYGAVSMRMIADAVGMRVGGLYNHFPNKQALLFQILSDHMHSLLSAATEDMPGTGTPAQRLEAFVRFHVGFHLFRPQEVFLSYMELRSLSPENFAAIEAMRAEYEGLLGAILRAGMDDGSFDLKDAQVDTMAILGALSGISTWYRPTGRLTSDDIEEIYVAFVLRSVGHSLAEVAHV